MKKSSVLCYKKNTLEPITISHNDRLLHTLVIGPTGCGKSSLVFTPLILQDVLSEKCGVTLFDPKEDLVELIYTQIKNYCPERIVYINPLSQNCPKINPLSGSEDIVIKNLITIFSPTFITQSSSEKLDLDINRVLISKSVKLLKRYPSLVGGNLNLKTYYDFICNDRNQYRPKCVDLLDILNGQQIDLDYIEILEWLIYHYYENKEGLMDKCLYTRGRIEQLISNKYLLNILTPSPNETQLINFNKHLLDGDIVLINTKTTVLGALGKVFGEFLMLEYMNCVFNRYKYSELSEVSRNQVPPNFLYIDEFTTYSPVINDLFLQGRSFKIGIHIAIQDRHMLSICGGDNTEHQAFAIETNCRNIILFPGVSGETATYYAHEFFNFKAPEIMYRPFGQIIYRIIKDNNVMAPEVGLVFFIDQQPNKDSESFEYKFKYMPDGTVQLSLQEESNTTNNEEQEKEDDDFISKYLN